MRSHRHSLWALGLLLASLVTLSAASPFAGYYKGVIRLRGEALGHVTEAPAYYLTLSVDNNGQLVTETIGVLPSLQSTVRFYPYVTGQVNNDGTMVLNEGAPFEAVLAPLPAPDTKVTGTVMKITSETFTAGVASQKLTLLATNLSAIPSNAAPRINFILPGQDTNLLENLDLAFNANFITWAQPATVQWWKDGQPLPGATNVFNFDTGLIFSGVTPAQAGAYSVVVSNPFGSATSKVVRVTVSAAPPPPPGAADPNFDPGAGPGLQIVPGLVTAGLLNCMAPLPDGKLIVGGYWDRFNNQPNPGLARLNSNGSLDTQFYPALTNQFSPTNDIVNGVVRQSDGRLVVLWLGGIDRLEADGTIDRTFHHFDAPGGGLLGLQSDDRILWGGNGLGLRRLTRDGFLDTSFSHGASQFGGGVISMLVQSDDKVVYFGDLNYADGVGNIVPVSTNSMARLNADGTTDTSFNAPVRQSIDQSSVRTIDEQPGGKLILGGAFTRLGNTTNLIGIARLNATGSLDTSFQSGHGLRLKFPIAGLFFDGFLSKVQCLADGKILIGGVFSVYDDVGRTNLARLNANGSLDTTFNPGSQHPDSLVSFIEPTLNGKFFIGGQFKKVGATPRVNLARIAGDAPQPTPRPSITTQPAARSVALGGSTTFTVAANNATGYAWQFEGQTLSPFTPAGIVVVTNVFAANTATLLVSNITAANQGTYKCLVTGPGGSTESAAAKLTVTGIPAPDTQPPTVAITSPKGPSFITLSNTVVLSGTAKDNASVTQVLASISGGPFLPVIGTTAWNLLLSLEPGTNLVVVKAIDSAGLQSMPARLTVVQKVASTLHVTLDGLGSVMPALDGTLQELGKPIQLTATPAKGWVFSNWIVGAQAVLDPKLSVTMSSNLSVTAHFVTNRFLSAQGVFNGLALDPAAPEHPRSGFLTLKLLPTGAFSGSIMIGGKKISGKGQFDLAGRCVLSIPAADHGNPATLDLNMDATGGIITGSLTDHGGPVPVRMVRNPFSAATPAAAFAGLYTLLIQPGPGNPLGIGDGFGSAKIDAAGNVTLAALLADASPAAQKVGISRNGEWPLFVSLYAGKGSILGWVRIDSNAPNALITADGLHWTRPAQVKGPYSGGFTNTFTPLGSPYPLPVAGRILPFTDGRVILEGADLSGSVTNGIRLEIDNKITNLSSNALKISITAPKGLFKGTVTRPEGGKPIPVQGALLPRQNLGGGFLPGTNSTGAVYLGP